MNSKDLKKTQKKISNVCQFYIIYKLNIYLNLLYKYYLYLLKSAITRNKPTTAKLV